MKVRREIIRTRVLREAYLAIAAKGFKGDEAGSRRASRRGINSQHDSGFLAGVGGATRREKKARRWEGGNGYNRKQGSG